jgi:drug/metabolite transporter (DMT)-like permease
VLLYTVARGLQKATLQKVTAVGLALTGITLVIGVFGSNGLRLDPIGVMAGLVAAFAFAFYNIGGHDILARLDRWIVLLYVTASATAFWLLVNPPWKLIAAHYSAGQWIFLVLFSLISVMAPFSCYFAGLQYLEPTRAIVVSCLEPVFSIVIAAIALGELVRPLQVVGIVFVLAAITVVQLPDRRSTEPVTIVEPIE